MYFYCTTAPTLTHDILGYVSLAFLIAIFLIALRINSKLSDLSIRDKKVNRPNPSSNTEQETQNNVNVLLGTPFDEFLNEDPARRAMSKKEQFAAYRDWRSAKGLNWK
jgi:hypothetical protein